MGPVVAPVVAPVVSFVFVLVSMNYCKYSVLVLLVFISVILFFSGVFYNHQQVALLAET